MNAVHNDSKVSIANQDPHNQVCMGQAFLSIATAATSFSKCGMLHFLIVIYHSRTCKWFHFLKSAEWGGFCLLRSALCHEMGTG